MDVLKIANRITATSFIAFALILIGLTISLREEEIILTSLPVNGGLLGIVFVCFGVSCMLFSIRTYKPKTEQEESNPVLAAIGVMLLIFGGILFLIFFILFFSLKTFS